MIKNTGIVRRLDELGRITIPKEMRDVLGMDDRCKLEIWSDGNNIMLRKYEVNKPACPHCGETEGLVEIDGLRVCKNFVSETYRMLKAQNTKLGGNK